MNNGKICISVCAQDAEEFIESAIRAEKLADVVELRFDCLEKSELNNALEKACKLNDRQTLLLTLRPREEGGRQDLTVKERESFWCAGYGFRTHWADIELDLVEMVAHRTFEKIICSYHNFDSAPADLLEIYDRLKSTGSDVLKIAIQTSDISETVAIWKLLEIARAENIFIIPIAMGEAGKWTRILGLAHGAFMTYAALESGKETASGQISADDLIETYRVKDLDENTEIYGIIGKPVSHSLSPYIHNAAFKFHKINAVYIPFEVKNLDTFIAKFVKPETREINLNFKGFSVTAPHKQAIIKHLEAIDETAKAIGAVNTVKIIDGKLYGYNTDAEGFIEPLRNAYGDLKNVEIAVLGNGGAARAAIFALKESGASITIFVRNLAKADLLAKEFGIEIRELNTGTATFENYKIIVNTTPLGTKGALEKQTAISAEQMSGAHLVYDLVYNPFETRFMSEAKSINVPTIGGLAMLIAQAMGQFKIWTELDAPMQAMSRAALSRI